MVALRRIKDFLKFALKLAKPLDNRKKICYNNYTKRKDGRNQMEIKQRLEVSMKKEEREILKKAIDILVDIELNAPQEQLDMLQNTYEEELDGVPHHLALPTAIDYMGVLLDNAFEPKEIEELEI